MDPILDVLNPQQRDAVMAPDRPLLIVAGAGTGKTRVITHRLAYMVRDRGVRPFHIFATTFTNKAAEEMRRRAAELTEHMCSPDFQIATFHSHCARILRREAEAVGLDRNFSIADEQDQLRTVKAAMQKLGYSEKEMKAAEARNVINQCKMRLLGPDSVAEYRDSPLTADYAAIYAEYEAMLRQSNSVDFEDLLLRTVQLFRSSPEILSSYRRKYRHILVDEYQDTNTVQVELVALLAEEHRALTVVGDEDQSIYSWRGADISNLLEFQSHFPEATVVRLEQNYRSTGNILKAAAAVIANNTERLGKTLFTADGYGPPIYAIEARDEYEETRGIAYALDELNQRHGIDWSEMAIFYRIAALSRVVEDRLREARIPYRIIGGVRFYDRMEVKDLLAYLQVAVNPHNQIALTRIVNTPRRGIGDKTIEAALEAAATSGKTLFHIMLDPPASLGRSASKLTQFARQIDSWHGAAATMNPSALFDRILQESRYIEGLGDPDSMETKARVENLEELKSAIVEFERGRTSPTLTEYLEVVSLVSPTDELASGSSAVSLMTIHAAKGLEFPAVVVMGLEQGLFPNQRAYTERGDLEEERRLFYVAVTRARRFLILSRCQCRVWYGETRWAEPSVFLEELPAPIIESLDPYRPAFSDRDWEPEERSDSWEDTDIIYDGNRPGSRKPAGGLPFTTGRSTSSSSSLPPTPRPTRRVEYDDEERPQVSRHSRSAFVLGGRVRHPILGTGTVTGLTEGKSPRILVRFDDGTVTQILAQYANLDRLDE